MFNGWSESEEEEEELINYRFMNKGLLPTAVTKNHAPKKWCWHALSTMALAWALLALVTFALTITVIWQAKIIEDLKLSADGDTKNLKWGTLNGTNQSENVTGIKKEILL